MGIARGVKAGERERWRDGASTVHLVEQGSSERETGQTAGGWGTLGGGEGGEARRTKPMISLTVEHIFSVAGPDLVVCLLVSEGAGSCGIAGHHVEACIGQLVKGLLEEGELEIVA